MPRKKRELFIDVCGYVLFYGFFNLLKILPCYSYEMISKAMGKFFYFTLPALKRKIRKNIDAAYGELDLNEKKVLVKKIIEKQTFFFIEWALWAKISPEKALALIEFKGLEKLKEVSESRKPAIIVSAHLGNFAVMLAALTYAGLPLSWIARDANNEFLARFFDRTRRKKGIYGISKKNLSYAVVIASKWLEKGNMLALLIDQHSGKGVEVDFFGRKVYAPAGAVAFARKYDAAVFFAFIKHKKHFKHTIFIEGPCQIIKTENQDYDFQKNTQFFYNRIEHFVRQSPEEWFTWLHRRFR